MKLNWRMFLATAQVLLAAALLIASHFEKQAHQIEQQRRVTTGWELRVEWDYIPRAEVLLLTLNSPPSLLSAPFRVQIGKFKLAFQLAFLLAVGLFWYWIGGLLDKRARQYPMASSSGAQGGRRWTRVFGLLGSLTLLGIGVQGLLTGGLPLIIHLGDILWAFILGVYFVKELTRGRAASAATAQSAL
jgi:hypothetical protein